MTEEAPKKINPVLCLRHRTLIDEAGVRTMIVETKLLFHVLLVGGGPDATTSGKCLGCLVTKPEFEQILEDGRDLQKKAEARGGEYSDGGVAISLGSRNK